MKRPRFEVADIFRRYGKAFREGLDGPLSDLQQRVMSAIERCRTAALGGQIEQCGRCGHRRYCYRSCRNRHCPKCQFAARAQWVEQRCAELLECPYFHLVFTLPREIAAIALQNKRVTLSILFRAATRALREIAADPAHLGAQIGGLAVLHTWGQCLQFHPHVHCVVPGGGLAPEHDRWIASRPRFFLPVKVLSRRFRTLFLHQLRSAFRKGQLRFGGALAALSDPEAFDRYLQPLRRAEWVVYSKPPFAGPAKVLAYLGRYTHRVAIANHRLLAIGNGLVRFRWRDYRRGGKRREMTLTAPEFIRRFLLHTLPPKFHKIRYFGFLAACHRRKRLRLCRELLGMPEPPPAAPPPDFLERYRQLTGRSLLECPACGAEAMLTVAKWRVGEEPPPLDDTS